jgi:hypothetical protein
MSDPDPQQLIEQLAKEACISLFEAYGVTLEEGHALEPRALDRALTGIVGFTGQGITGMCLLVCAEAPLLASMPTDGSLRDWSAEMSNQLVGRIKHKLLAHGVEVYITTPIVLRAARIEPMPKRAVQPIGFHGDGGAVAIWVEVETSHDFRFAPGEEPVAEGETLLF